MDKVTSCLIADRIAKYAGFATTWGAHTGIGTLPLVFFGNEQQKRSTSEDRGGENVARMRCRRQLPVLMRSTAEPAPSFQPMASTIC